MINGFCHIFSFNLTSPTHPSKCHHLQICSHSIEGKRTFKLLSAQQYDHNHLCVNHRQLQKCHIWRRTSCEKEKSPISEIAQWLYKKASGSANPLLPLPPQFLKARQQQYIIWPGHSLVYRISWLNLFFDDHQLCTAFENWEIFFSETSRPKRQCMKAKSGSQNSKHNFEKQNNEIYFQLIFGPKIWQSKKIDKYHVCLAHSGNYLKQWQHYGGFFELSSLCRISTQLPLLYPSKACCSELGTYCSAICTIIFNACLEYSSTSLCKSVPLYHAWYFSFFYTIAIEAKNFYTWKCVNLRQKWSREKSVEFYTVCKLLHCV